MKTSEFPIIHILLIFSYRDPKLENCSIYFLQCCQLQSINHYFLTVPWLFDTFCSILINFYEIFHCFHNISDIVMTFPPLLQHFQCLYKLSYNFYNISDVFDVFSNTFKIILNYFNEIFDQVRNIWCVFDDFSDFFPLENLANLRNFQFSSIKYE